MNVRDAGMDVDSYLNQAHVLADRGRTADSDGLLRLLNDTSNSQQVAEILTNLANENTKQPSGPGSEGAPANNATSESTALPEQPNAAP